MDSVQSSNACITNSIGESKDYRKTPASFEVLRHVCMCNNCSSEVAGQLEEHSNKGVIGSLGSSEDTETGTLINGGGSS